jgi:gliding motility-associated-like protein
MKGEKHQVSYVAKPIQPYFFSWEPASVFVSQSKLSTPNVIFQNSTLVKLTITNSKGCPLSDTAVVRVVLPPKEIMPTGFTPNRDLLNDGFGMPNIFETQDISIYNRLGVLVYRGDSQHPKWDGFVNGVLADEGVYYYTLLARLRGTEQWVKYGGNVTLLR